MYDQNRVHGYKYQGASMSSHSAMLRQGDLEAALHIMDYLKLRHNSRLAFDPSFLNINHRKFWHCYWADFYEDAVEVIPSNAHHQRGSEVELKMKVGSNYAGNMKTRRSRTGFMILRNWNF